MHAGRAREGRSSSPSTPPPSNGSPVPWAATATPISIVTFNSKLTAQASRRLQDEPNVLLLLSTDAAADLNLQKHHRHPLRLSSTPTACSQQTGPGRPLWPDPHYRTPSTPTFDKVPHPAVHQSRPCHATRLRRRRAGQPAPGRPDRGDAHRSPGRRPAHDRHRRARTQQGTEPREPRPLAGHELGDDTITTSNRPLNAALDARRGFPVRVADFSLYDRSTSPEPRKRTRAGSPSRSVPANWAQRKVQRILTPSSAMGMRIRGHAARTRSSTTTARLTPAATQCIRGAGFDPPNDHRMAVRVLNTINSPDLVATFIARLRARGRPEMERLLAVRRARTEPSARRRRGLIDGQDVADAPDDEVPSYSEPSWEAALARRPRKRTLQRQSLWIREVTGQPQPNVPSLRDRFKPPGPRPPQTMPAPRDDPNCPYPGMETRTCTNMKRRLREQHEGSKRATSIPQTSKIVFNQQP